MKYIPRKIETLLLKSIANIPVTAIIGPRQCGKSTLVKHLLKQIDKTLYLDLERPSDLQKLKDAEFFLSQYKTHTICIDEIQRKPELFPLMRSLVDEWDENGKFIILGSASRDLIKQSSETLAGRIFYHQLTPFLWSEINHHFSDYFLKGGFPLSLLNNDNEMSLLWRENFINTFLERDLLQWAHFTPKTMYRLWQMLANNNGQTVNYTKFASSLGVSDTTVKSYIELLQGTFMIEVVPPYLSNLGKRMIKAPKVYVADSGITSALLGLNDFNKVAGHAVFGSIWEQIVLTNIKAQNHNANVYFYRSSTGNEIDFVLDIHGCVFAIECKSTSSPSLSEGNYKALEDIKPLKTFVVIPHNKKKYLINNSIEVVSISQLIEDLKK
ncbi:MAG: ATP-binding protein [Bacteroidales bacterium]|jgi:predicted AAA+ superfamily ATPase|nr:ATP-binding protein [Bacteroidales bacterium]